MTNIKTMITELHEALESETNYMEGLEQLLFVLCEGDLYGDTRTYMEDKYEYNHLEQEGGGEGNGEYCYGVFSLKGVCYMAEYSYYSYVGHNTDSIVDTLCEVVAEEVVVTVYNTKK